MRVELSDNLLFSVQRPARYVGGEINTVVKDHAKVRASIALAFPDLYDIALWYQGFHILYPLVNSHEDFLAERVYCPWPDMAEAMRREGIPLHGTETRTPVREFSVVGFTLQHELNYTNILEMLDLAGIPMLAKDRRDSLPIVIAGGPGALAPEPLSPFVDAFVIGEGEDIVTEILETCALFDSFRDRSELMVELAKIRGLYVPSLYESNGSDAVHRVRDDIPEMIERRLFDLPRETWSVKPVVPLAQLDNDRFSLEIKRGCTRGCRFCQAGMITRPLRERTPEQIIELTAQGLANTGHREVSLMSLSSADYSALAPLMREINERHRDDNVSIALSSIRVNAFDVQFADEISKGRKTGFTFAPEAGSERLRSVINKELSDANFLNVVAHVFSRGWQRLKFYFMCGLPTETDEDLMGIVDITRRACEIGRRFWGRKFEIAVSVSPFIPKAHTPFQWEPQLSVDEVDRRWHLVADALRSEKNVVVRPHSAKQAWVEGVLAKGGRGVGLAMKRAWELGARFDGWDEHFQFDLWRQAIEEEGIAVDELIHQKWDYERPLPWDHIDAALGKKFLTREHQKSLQRKLTPDCAFNNCVGCESCDFETIMNVVVEQRPQNTYESLGEAPPAPDKIQRQEPMNTNPDPVTRLRFRLTKQGVTKYLSHLDFSQTINRTLLRAGLPLAHSQGFNPKPRVMLSPSLPLGYTSTAECVDVQFYTEGDPHAWLEAIRRVTVPGIDWDLIGVFPPHGGNIQADVTQADYRITVSDTEQTVGLSADAVAKSVDEFLALESLEIEETSHIKKRRPKGRRGRGPSGPKVKTKDYRALTLDLNLVEQSGEQVVIDARLACGGGGAIDPLRLLARVLDREIKLGDQVQVERVGLWSEVDGERLSVFGDCAAKSV